MTGPHGVLELEAQRQQAVDHHRAGRLEAAEQAYRQLLLRQPMADVAANLGALLRGQGRVAEAEAHYAWALSACPADPQLLANACNLLREAGKAEATLPLLEGGLARWPQDFGLRQGFALTLHHCGRIEEALRLLPQLVQDQPDAANLRLEWGACLAKQGHREQALEQFEQAARLDPADPRALANSITMLTELGRHREALERVEQAPTRHGDTRLMAAEAGLRHAINDVDAALSLYQQLTQLEPGVAEHWLNLAGCQKNLRQMVAPLEALREGLKRSPDRFDLQLSLGSLLIEHGRYAEGLRLVQSSIQHSQTSDTAHSIYQFAAAGNRLVSAKALREHMAAWELDRGLKPSELWSDRIRDPDPHRPLRVGYLSPDYCNHPVGRFIEPIFEAHDRRAVQVIGLSCGPHADEQHRRLRDLCDDWYDLRYGDDLRIARFLSDLRLDIIVDLGGHTAHQRLRVLTARPAPIQLSYLGYPASTYLSCMDGWIGDACLFGSGQEQERGPREQLIALSRCYLAYRPRPAAPALERTAADARFRFGCFNHTRKFSDACLDLFAAVLKAVPDSLLVLKSTTFTEPAEQQRIAQRLQKRGISLDRLELLERADHIDDHLALYGRMDVALDTLPYSGTTTTCEALWMGVPVLTLAGQVMVERQSAAVLEGANLGAAIATSDQDLLRRAQAMSARGVRTTADRQALRDHILRSALFDSEGLVRELEGCYRQLWQQRSLFWRL